MVPPLTTNGMDKYTAKAFPVSRDLIQDSVFDIEAEIGAMLNWLESKIEDLKSKGAKRMSADIERDGEGNYVYEAVEITNYDGDSFRLTVRKRWDFGFGIDVVQEYKIATRINGVDTPELRDKRPDWKAAGYLARDRARTWVAAGNVKFISMDKPDKYGRALGDFENQFGELLSEYLIDNGLGVAYHGQNKAEVEAAHEANIEALKSSGLIP